MKYNQGINEYIMVSYIRKRMYAHRSRWNGCGNELLFLAPYVYMLIILDECKKRDAQNR